MFRRRRRSFRRSSRGGRGLKRREPTWITTAFSTPVPPTTVNNTLFQLVGPEDYTPEFLTDPNRSERTLLVRTVGSFTLIPLLPEPTEVDTFNIFTWKAALFVGSDKGVDDRLAADPAQFELIDATTFVTFCRDFAPLKIFWAAYVRNTHHIFTDVPSWVPPCQMATFEWDVTVKRRLEGDEALYLLITNNFLQSPPDPTTGGFIDVESRNLLME